VKTRTLKAKSLDASANICAMITFFFIKGDSLIDTGRSVLDLVGMQFSTYNNGTRCNIYAKGGWWFNTCYQVYLNGIYNSAKWEAPWYPSVEYGTDVSRTKMMIRKN
jgi:hypothetical protein